MAESMEVSRPSEHSATGSSVPGSRVALSVSLHPLVLLNISDHWTRTRAGESQASNTASSTSTGNNPTVVIGCLLGKHLGRCIEVESSFEMVFQKIENLPVIDKDFYFTRESQCKKSLLNFS